MPPSDGVMCVTIEPRSTVGRLRWVVAKNLHSFCNRVKGAHAEGACSGQGPGLRTGEQGDRSVGCHDLIAATPRCDHDPGTGARHPRGPGRLLPAPAGMAFQGLILGLLGSLVAVGMALIYRANRILNFAQGDLGTAPTVLAVALVVYGGPGTTSWPPPSASWPRCCSARSSSWPSSGASSTRPRLILTVATIGLSQLLAVGALFIPRIWGERPSSSQLHVPFTVRFTIEPARVLGRPPGRPDRGAAGADRCGRHAPRHQHRHRHPGQRRAGRPRRAARRPGEAAPDGGVGGGRAAVVHRASSCRPASSGLPGRRRAEPQRAAAPPSPRSCSAS